MTWLVVGLGNPGPTYARTRHNIGYLTVEILAGRLGAKFSAKLLMRAAVAEGRIGSEKVVLVKPTTFMNESGIAVRKVANFFKVDPENIVVIHDELDLDLGRMRCKLGGGDNGHNGLKSIRAHLATGDFHRIRLGIGRPPGQQPGADYVLGAFNKSEVDEVGVVTQLAADAVETLITEGLVAAQNKFNG